MYNTFNGRPPALFDSLTAEVSVWRTTHQIKITYSEESPDPDGRPVYDVEWTSIYSTHKDVEHFQRAIHLNMSQLLELLVGEKLGAFLSL